MKIKVVHDEYDMSVMREAPDGDEIEIPDDVYAEWITRMIKFEHINEHIYNVWQKSLSPRINKWIEGLKNE